MKQIETMVTKLKAIPEGNGTMFDNTTIIYLPETGAGHHSPDTEAPMIVMIGSKSKLDLPAATSACPSTAPRVIKP